MKMSSVVLPACILAVATVLIFGIHGQWDLWKSDATVQKTNDAYVTADQIPLSTRISGTVRRVDVQDYEAVKTGQLIVELEDADYQAAADEANSAVEAARSEFTGNEDAKRTADANVTGAEGAVAQAEAVCDATQSGIDAEQAQVSQATSEFERQSKLLADRAATRQQFEQAQAVNDASHAVLQSKRYPDYEQDQAG